MLGYCRVLELFAESWSGCRFPIRGDRRSHSASEGVQDEEIWFVDRLIDRSEPVDRHGRRDVFVRIYEGKLREMGGRQAIEQMD